MNLLPEEYKKELAYEAWRRYLVAFGFYAGSVLIIALTLLLPSFFFLKLQIGNFQKNLDTIQRGEDYRRVFTKQKEVGEINRALSVFVNFDKTTPQVSTLLDGLFAHAANPDIVFFSLTYNRGLTGGAGSFVILGKAARRDALRALTESLSKDPRVGLVSSPITNLIEQENNTFSITVNLK